MDVQLTFVVNNPYDPDVARANTLEMGSIGWYPPQMLYVEYGYLSSRGKELSRWLAYMNRAISGCDKQTCG